MTTLLAIIFIVICVLLIIIVLLQKGRGGGLGGILGGGGQSAFGTRTGDVFTWITIALVGIFLLLAIGTTKLFRGGEKAQISTPEFIPEPRSITEAKRITIKCNPRKAEIFYTLDGSEPIRNKSRKYDIGIPIHITPGTTLKARAFHNTLKDSDIMTGEYPHPSTTTTAPAATTLPTSRPDETEPN